GPTGDGAVPGNLSPGPDGGPRGCCPLSRAATTDCRSLVSDAVSDQRPAVGAYRRDSPGVWVCRLFDPPRAVPAAAVALCALLDRDRSPERAVRACHYVAPQPQSLAPRHQCVGTPGGAPASARRSARRTPADPW